MTCTEALKAWKDRQMGWKWTEEKEKTLTDHLAKCPMCKRTTDIAAEITARLTDRLADTEIRRRHRQPPKEN